ncbi:hypothetical protein [Micromonospora echinofusca]|uniref:Dynamin family protein n=1 Tax=Micromonospora echinofusca TaxID=47858 RepID=A0ABS3VVH6_MICEH|nr:hypothetical protein [Micromonospora echinofusca]MBO4208544.1 hypothetical protein [Micromonospora echinofusca]
MDSGPLRRIVAANYPLPGLRPGRSGPDAPGPDDPLAVVAVGPAGALRRELLAGLLDTVPELLTVPAGSYLVLHHDRTPTRMAYVPGLRQPHRFTADPFGVGPVPTRPPRRVELASADPLLRHFSLVDAPDTDQLGPAAVRVLLDVVDRAGALLWVTAADQTFTAAELHLLAEVAARQVAVFFVLTPAAPGRFPDPGDEPAESYLDPVAITLHAHRVALLSAVPALAGAAWLAPDATDLGPLRRALVDWAVQEGLRRASSQPPPGIGGNRRVPVRPGVERDDWADRLEREVRAHVQRIRQDLALELANIHLRAVQEIVFGVGCVGLPHLLDRELHALSLQATAACDRAVDRILDDAFVRVLGRPADDDVRRRVVTAVQFGFTDPPTEHGRNRVLLVTSTAGVAALTGPGATDALAAFAGPGRTALLPPVGLALSGSCYQYWRTPANDDTGQARSWVQRALREIELELQRQVSGRFEAFRLSLTTVLNDAVEHGILLA